MTANGKSWQDSFAVYSDPKVLSIFFLGYSSGLPLLLVGSTLSAWLKEEGLSLTTIGLFSLTASAYNLKFLWSPLVDRLPLPPLTTLLGRRRGWLLLSQLFVLGCIVGLGTNDPSADLRATALWAVALAFASATQDIVVDAYRTDVLPDRELGAGSAMYTWGYRVAMLAAGAGALFVADVVDWFWAYVVMAATVAVGIVTTLLIREPPAPSAEEVRAAEAELVGRMRDRFGVGGAAARALAWLDRAVVAPFSDFMRREGWVVVLLFIAFYKYGDALLSTMANPFYLDIGFTKSQIAAITKVFGFVMTIAGVLLGGLLVARIGILRALLIAGFLQAASNLVFAAQAMVGDSAGMLAVTISIENLTGGMGTAAFVAYLSSLCNLAYTATQYALLSSLMALARNLFSAGGGWLADQMSWVSFFLVTTLAAIPGLVLLVWMMRRYPPR